VLKVTRVTAVARKDALQPTAGRRIDLTSCVMAGEGNFPYPGKCFARRKMFFFWDFFSNHAISEICGKIESLTTQS